MERSVLFTSKNFALPHTTCYTCEKHQISSRGIETSSTLNDSHALARMKTVTSMIQEQKDTHWSGTTNWYGLGNIYFLYETRRPN